MLLALWAPTIARAATYYVDYASGADTNNGTSTAWAWKHCPGDFAVTGIPATNNLKPGDTVFFKGGVVYSIASAAVANIYGVVQTNSGIIVNHSGTVGNVITYDGTGNSWGTGKAIVDGGYILNGGAFKFNAGMSYIAVNSFEIRNCGGYADDDPVVTNAAAGVYGNNGISSWIPDGAMYDGNGNYLITGLQTNTVYEWRPATTNDISCKISAFITLTNDGTFSGVTNVTLTGINYSNGVNYLGQATSNILAKVWQTNAVLMTTPRYGIGLDLSTGNNTNIYLANLFVHRIGCWRTTLGWDTGSVSGGGIVAVSPQSLTITNCEFTQIGGVGIEVLAATDVHDVLISDCFLHKQIAWGLDIAPYSDNGITISNLTITKTRILDMNDMGGGWTGVGGSSGGPHMNYIFMRQAGSVSYWTNVFITRCWFGETNASSAGGGGTAAIFLSQGPSVNIYNNIFCRVWATCNVGPGYPVLPNMSQVVRIYNNTFQRGSGMIISSSPAAAGDKKLFIQNNLFTEESGVPNNAVMLAEDGATNIVTLNYNIYYSKDWPASGKWIGSLPSNRLFSMGQYDIRLLGFETNGLYADPLFVDASNAVLTSRNFMVLSGSPAIGAGMNLTAYFTTDYAGNPRPASGPWTIGAFEAPSSNNPPPSLLLLGPPSMNKGESAILSWSCIGATNLNITGIGNVPLKGSTNVSPVTTTTYTATALGIGTSKQISITVSVK
jgi:hypothetical protein